MRFIEILDAVEQSWSIKEKARYIYTNIGKNISYDERFAYSQDADLLQSIYNRKIDIYEEEDPRLICKTSNLVYLQLLEKLGIKAELLYRKSTIKRPIDVEDVALMFWDEEGNKYYTNIIGDIENCRFGVRTHFFGITRNLYERAQDVSEISSQELKEIDRKTYYIKSDYNDIVFKLLAEELKNTNNFKRFLKAEGIDTSNISRDALLKNKMQYINKLIKFRDRTAGPDEHKKFYKRLFCTSVLDKFESKKFYTYEYIKEEGKNIEVLSVIKINLQGIPIYYLYSEEEQTYIQLTKEEILEKIKGYRERKGKNILESEENCK